MRLLFLAAILFVSAHAGAGIVQTLDAGSSSDSDMVHAGMHYSAGVWIGWAQDGMDQIYRLKPWYLRAAVSGLAALALTDLYEQGTDKSNVVRAQHDFAGFLGGISVPLAVTLRW